MRGSDRQQSGMFGYTSSEERVPKDHPLRAIRAMVDVALLNMGPQCDEMYAKVGTALDCAREAVGGAVAAGALYGAQ